MGSHLNSIQFLMYVLHQRQRQAGFKKNCTKKEFSIKMWQTLWLSSRDSRRSTFLPESTCIPPCMCVWNKEDVCIMCVGQDLFLFCRRIEATDVLVVQASLSLWLPLSSTESPCSSVLCPNKFEICAYLAASVLYAAQWLFNVMTVCSVLKLH